MIIKPLISRNLKILFVGINPVKKSFKNGEYQYFSSNSYFYTLLKEAGITDKKINSSLLLQYGIGITNFYYDVFGDYTKVKNSDKYEEELVMLILKYSPKKIAFLSKHIAKLFCGKNRGGWLAGIYYCVPFPTLPMKEKDKIKYYRELL